MYEYYGESSPELKKWEDALIEEAVNYVSGATGHTIEFVNGVDGVWKYISPYDLDVWDNWFYRTLAQKEKILF